MPVLVSQFGLFRIALAARSKSLIIAKADAGGEPSTIGVLVLLWVFLDTGGPFLDFVHNSTTFGVCQASPHENFFCGSKTADTNFVLNTTYIYARGYHKPRSRKLTGSNDSSHPRSSKRLDFCVSQTFGLYTYLYAKTRLPDTTDCML